MKNVMLALFRTILNQFIMEAIHAFNRDGRRIRLASVILVNSKTGNRSKNLYVEYIVVLSVKVVDRWVNEQLPIKLSINRHSPSNVLATFHVDDMFQGSADVDMTLGQLMYQFTCDLRALTNGGDGDTYELANW